MLQEQIDIWDLIDQLLCKINEKLINNSIFSILLADVCRNYHFFGPHFINVRLFRTVFKDIQTDHKHKLTTQKNNKKKYLSVCNVYVCQSVCMSVSMYVASRSQKLFGRFV